MAAILYKLKTGCQWRQLPTGEFFAAYRLCWVKHRSAKKFQQQLEQRIKYHAAEDLLRYSWMKDLQNKVPLTEEYLTFKKAIPVENETAVITQYYAASIREIVNTTLTGMGDIRENFTLPEIIDAVKSAGGIFNPEEEAFLRSTAILNKNRKGNSQD